MAEYLVVSRQSLPHSIILQQRPKVLGPQNDGVHILWQQGHPAHLGIVRLWHIYIALAHGLG
jgi:hypothetical protein